MELADYKFYVDWNNDGDYGEAYEDITADVMGASWQRGFSGPPPAQANAGSLTLTLRNGTGKYTATNQDSPIVMAYGGIRPGIKVRITMQVPGGSTSNAAVMLLDMIETDASGVPLPAGTARLSAIGVFSKLVRGDVNVALHEQITTSSAVSHVLTAVGWTYGSTIDASPRTTILKWWVRSGQSPIEAIRELEAAEIGRFWEAKDGKVVFDGRNHIFVDDHASPRVTYGIGGFRMWDPKLLNSNTTVYNAYRGQQRTFNLSDEVALVTIVDVENGQGGKPPRIPAGGDPIVIWMELNEKNSPNNYIGVYEWTDSGGVGVEANSSIDGLGADVWTDLDFLREDFGPKIKMTFWNNGSADLYLTKLIAYGIAIIETDPIEIKEDDSASQDIYGISEYPAPNPWCTDLEDGRDEAQYIVDRFKDPRTVIQFKLVSNVDHEHLVESQTIDVGDRIRINDQGSEGSVYGLYVDDEFIVDSVQHDVTNDGRIDVVTVTCTQALHSPAFRATITDYDAKTIPDEVEAAVPDDLYCTAMDPMGKMVVGIVAWKYNNTITEAEIRAHYTTDSPVSVDMRLSGEGGTWTPNGTTRIRVTGLYANKDGVNFPFNAYDTGRWYYTGRLKNSAGWSVWSDGNDTPSNVKDWVSTDSVIGAGSDAGPPDGSTVRATMTAGGVVVTASKPATNGGTILAAFAQIRDANVGAWYDLDEEAADSPADVYYDGSGVDAVYDKTTGTITKASGSFGCSSGLVLFDVRADSSWSLDWCQWGYATGITGGTIPGCIGFRPLADPDVGSTRWEHVRIKIVKPPWEWNTFGYISTLAELVYWWNPIPYDKTTSIFEFPVIPLPPSMAMGSVVARAFFENKICRAECGYSSAAAIVDTGNPQGAYGLEIITHATDPAIPDGMMKFRWYRDTINYENIYCAAFWLNQSTPPEGPFSSDRGSPGFILETGTCTITAGDPNVTVTRTADPTVVNMALVIYTSDPTPDNDIDANWISAEGTNSLTTTPFGKSGTFSYAIVKPWYYTGSEYTTNFAYYQFSIDEITYQIDALQWETPLMPCPAGLWYVVGASRNPFGLGSRLYADSATGGGTQQGCQAIGLVPADSTAQAPYSAYTIAAATDVYYIDAEAGSFVLENPTGQLYCGRPFVWIIKQPDSDSNGPSEIYFGDKFRFCDEIQAVTLSVTPGVTDYLGAIYFLPWDKFKIVALVHNFQETP